MLALAALERLYLACTDQGIVWSDEIYQSLEQAHRAAFGYGLVPWEFRDAARSWFFPGSIALLWEPFAWLRLDQPLLLILVARFAMVALGLWGLWCSMQLAMRLAPEGAGPFNPRAQAAAWTALLGASLPVSLLFSFRALTEVAAAPLLAAAVLWLLDEKAHRAGLAIGAASFLRYQSALAGAGLLLWLLAHRRWRAAGQALAGIAAIALGCAALDFVTWGKPLLPLARYLEFNLVEGKASQFGVESSWFYLRDFVSANGWPATLALLAGLIASARRAPGLLSIALGFVLVHSFVPHKELRFILPVLPLLAALAGAGLARIPWPRAAIPAAAMAALLGAMSVRAARLDFGQLGDSMMHPARRTVWHTGEDINRMLLAASSRGDLCGITVVSESPWFTGGYTYLHRDVPLLFRSLEGNFGASNYVIASNGDSIPGTYQMVTKWEHTGLFRRPGGCAAPPSSYSRSF